MSFCPACGNTVRPDFAFCPSCGAKLPKDASGSSFEKERLRIESSKISGLMANYEGFLKDGIPEGNGIARYDNGDIYDGEWHEGVKHGQGTYNWPDGRKYEGSFCEDYLCGQGTMYFPDGNRYEGEFANDEMNGHGIMVFSNLDRYVGEWLNGKPSGHYRFYFSDGYYLDGNRISFSGNGPVFSGVTHDNTGKSFYYSGWSYGGISPRRCWTFTKQPDGSIYYNSEFEVKVMVVLKWKNGYSSIEWVHAHLNSRTAHDIFERGKEARYYGEHVMMVGCNLSHSFEPQKLFIIVRTSRKDNVEPEIIDYRLFGTREEAASVVKRRSGLDLSSIYSGCEYDSERDNYWQIICLSIEDFPEM